jgi:hypothetical protein
MPSDSSSREILAQQKHMLQLMRTQQVQIDELSRQVREVHARSQASISIAAAEEAARRQLLEAQADALRKNPDFINAVVSLEQESDGYLFTNDGVEIRVNEQRGRILYNLVRAAHDGKGAFVSADDLLNGCPANTAKSVVYEFFCWLRKLLPRYEGGRQILQTARLHHPHHALTPVDKALNPESKGLGYRLAIPPCNIIRLPIR